MSLKYNESEWTIAIFSDSLLDSSSSLTPKLWLFGSWLHSSGWLILTLDYGSVNILHIIKVRIVSSLAASSFKWGHPLRRRSRRWLTTRNRCELLGSLSWISFERSLAHRDNLEIRHSGSKNSLNMIFLYSLSYTTNLLAETRYNANGYFSLYCARSYIYTLPE